MRNYPSHLACGITALLLHITESSKNCGKNWGESIDFEEILLQAQAGKESAVEKLLILYQPLLMKESIQDGVFDEDLYQELCIILLNCIRNFHI